MNMGRRVIVHVVMSIAMLGALLVAASPAQAGNTTVLGCPPGHVCVYSGVPSSSTLVYRTEGNIASRKAVEGYILNNGRQEFGADHFYFEYRPNPGASWKSLCLHWANGSASIGTFAYFGAQGEIRNGHWGGECP